MTFTFAPATKEQAKARIALDGPSGSGKTWTALAVATVLAGDGKVALIDTERGSASKYSDDFTFDTLQLHTFEPATLCDALAAAGAAGYAVTIVDSLSHFWMGKGGMLQQVDNAAKRSGGNSFAGWKDARPMEQAMIDALLAYPGHVIVTMRTKTEWVIEQNDRGRNVPRKIGTKPEQREGIEYEFDVVGDLDLDNTLIVSKTRCSALSGAVLRKPGAEFAETIKTWLDGAPSMTALDYQAQAEADTATLDQLRKLYADVQKRNLTGAAVVSKGIPTTLGELLIARGHELQPVKEAS